MAGDLAEPGPSAIAYLIFHFFTEYNAPRRRPSGMFVARNCSHLCRPRRAGRALPVGSANRTNSLNPTL